MTDEDIDSAIDRVIVATTSNFLELVTIAGLDPAKDFRFANLCDIDFSDSNLAGFDFSGARLERASFLNARIAGAKFSHSPELDRQLSCAIDAKEALGVLRRAKLMRKRSKQSGNTLKLPSERSIKREIMMSALSKREDVLLSGSKAETLYHSADDNVRAVCSISKRRKSRRIQYWYGYSLRAQQFLSQSARAFVVLGFADRTTSFAIPNRVIMQITSRLHLTPGRHWHLLLEEEEDEQFSLLIPRGARVALAAFLLTR